MRVEHSLDVVAHISEAVPRYWFVDSPALQQFLTTELTYGLQVAIENAALATINATSGIMRAELQHKRACHVAKVADRARISRLRSRIHADKPGDWEAVELALASTNAIEHLSLPYGASARRLFGCPVVVSNAEAVGVSHTVGRDAVALDVDGTRVSVQPR